MSGSNVRSIESLEIFHRSMMELSSDWIGSVQEIRLMVQRADEHFSQNQPRYWRRQLMIAQRELGEARDQLQIKQSAVRQADRPPATEAAQRVRLAEQRVRLCHQKKVAAQKWSIEMSRQCDDLLGPLADVANHCEVILPAAAAELRQIIDQLKHYARQANVPHTSSPSEKSDDDPPPNE